MTAAAKAVSLERLKRRALSLGAVKVFDQAMTFALPMVLARCLDAHTFGEYRLLWLAIGTMMALATLNMPGGLYLFLPRSDARGKRLYIQQTIAFLAASGLVCAWAVSPWNPWLPAAVQPLAAYGALVPAFVVLWVVAALLDSLPTVEEDIAGQARATMLVSALRVTLIGAGAWVSGDLRVILWLLLAVVAVKLLLLFAYIQRRHGFGSPWFERACFADQFRNSAPFGFSSALYLLRGQSDQWVAASLFTLSSFAAFSIAAMIGQVVHIFRHSVLEAFLPSMSRLEAAGDVVGMMALNSRLNVLVGALLYPFLAFAFVFAEDLITIVYTASYVEAGPVVRVYVAAMVAMAVELGSVVLLLRQGGYALRVAAVVLPLSVALSWAAGVELGLAGAALGSVVAIYVDRVFMLRRVSRLTGIPVARLQDWRSLGWALLSAALAGCAAWTVIEKLHVASGALARAAIGGAVLAVIYLALNFRRFR